MVSGINGIAYEEAGSGSGALPAGRQAPLVLIHGFPFSRKMWKPQLEAHFRGRRTVAYDVRGHGESEVGDGRYTIDLYVDDLAALLDGLKISRAVLCGLSMGGYIALRTAERYPDRLAALVLCDTKSQADNDETKAGRATAIREIQRNGMAKFAETFVQSALSDETLAKKPEVVEFAASMIRATAPEGACGALRALASRTDTTASLSKISVPTLVLVGAQDKITPPVGAEALAHAIPGARLELVPSAGHLSNLENPDFFNAELAAFLAALR